jgi:uncharacterized protein (DUF488 family)
MTYYRRKILLALLYQFGGRLRRIDLQKLLFLFCQHTKTNYYDFFPHKFGAFSIVASQDKYVLEKYGYLKEDNDFVLTSNISFLEELKESDKKCIISFFSDFKNLKDRSLIKYSYLNYPEYSMKSTILDEVLDSKEISKVKNWWNLDNKTCLLSIGYEGQTIDNYLKKLIFNNVKAVIDVRKNPVSMKYGFSKKRFCSHLENADIKYFHFPELGIPSNLRKNLFDAEDYRKLFVNYQSNVLADKIEELNKIEELLIKYKRVALTCFENDHNFCHRNKITEYFEENYNSSYSITHI